MEDEYAPTNMSLSLRRRTSGLTAQFEEAWRKRWFRLGAYALGALLLVWLLLWFFVARNLPSVDQLKNYQPSLPTYVRSVDGTPVQSFARERRVQLKFEEYPQPLIRAFLAAEDKTFFDHDGLDYTGIVGAIFDYVIKTGSGERAKGGSTITQQVAKNLLLTDEYSVTRKLKEAILARRIEGVLTKQQILELYFNEIFLGRNAYGVQAASRAYFAKDVKDLTVPEAAYIAILPKAPSNYTPERHAQRALDRRNWVLGEMFENDFITAEERDAARALPLGTVPRSAATTEPPAGYYIEEVRRQLIEKFGENPESGRNPYSVYGGGLWVRTSFDPIIQGYTEEALRNGLMRYDGGRSWTGPIASLKAGPGWEARFAAANLGGGFADWVPAMVLEKGETSARIGFADGKTATMPAWAAAMVKRRTAQTAFSALKPGDVIVVKSDGANWILKSVPEISGGMVVQDPRTGRVLSMQGGFDSRIQTYNRATQAWRQPGSSFKPFVYAAALAPETGMTPASIIVDGPFCVYQSAKLGRKCFKNFGGGGGAGPQTMRWGLEQSRNLMTVRAASQAGMDNVVKLAASSGISKEGQNYSPVLAVSLGAGESTVIRMVNAYSILSRNGRDVKPSLIDFVQDRNGKVKFKADSRKCDRCNQPDWDGKAMPRPPMLVKQAIDAQAAYQVVHMLEGVIQRGTAKPLLKLGRPIFGKTGTTTGPTNVWFVGGSADLTAGVYLGFDQPRPMGQYAQGGTMAVPIFYDLAKNAMKDAPVIPFRAPAGMRLVRIDRSSGKKVYGAWPGHSPTAAVIWEAFQAETEPKRTIRQDEIAKPKGAAKALKAKPKTQARQASGSAQPRDSEFQQREGGIY
jgi:penicillin-binding protein 1A